MGVLTQYRMELVGRRAGQWCLGLLVLFASLTPPALAAPPLPALGASRDQLTVSGLSSGAYMAVQFQVAHAGLVAGAGIVAGGPYYCAEGLSARALANCMAPTASARPPTVGQQQAWLERAARQDRIDDPAGLRSDRVLLFSGAGDHTVDRSVVDALADFYRATLADPDRTVRYLKHPEAGHAMIAAGARQANACATSAPPFINRCQQLDLPGELLAHLLGPAGPGEASGGGDLLAFDQRPFVRGTAIDASLGDTGYVYLPAACRRGGCRVHVAFHGCRQGADTLGDRYVRESGYNRWADAYRLIVLYPQATPRYGLAWGSWKFILNPKGCWDWWGYTGADYATREARQIAAVKAMLDRLAEPPGAPQ